jgi:hypothetical protein
MIPLHTSGSARHQIASANVESLAHGGKLQARGRFPLNRKLAATDGPFAETKEGLGGAWLRLRRPFLNTTGPFLPRCSTPSSGDRGRGSDRPGVRVYQTTCAFCGLPLAVRGSVLFQGDHLVHATCWRADSKPFRDRRA